jgi:hypothetical protein
MERKIEIVFTKGIKMEPTPEQVAPIFALLMGAIGLMVGLTVLILTLVVWCKVFSKAGYNWAPGLLMLIPIANIVMMLILAFSDWPILKEIRELKTQPQQIAE